MLTPTVPSAVQVFNMMLQILEDGRLTDSKVGPAALPSGCRFYHLKTWWTLLLVGSGAVCCRAASFQLLPASLSSCCPGAKLAVFVTVPQGRTVDFKNTLLIMTSNVGSSVIEKGGGQLGFQLDIDQVLI